MPLYDCMLLVKPLVTREALAELAARVARRAYQRNGVVTDVKSFGTVQLGYGIKKLDGRHFKVSLLPDSRILFVVRLLYRSGSLSSLCAVTVSECLVDPGFGGDLMRPYGLKRVGRNAKVDWTTAEVPGPTYAIDHDGSTFLHPRTPLSEQGGQVASLVGGEA
ncbi:hypothetical protein E2562_016334 [Oryza meyeriana var. granulata]|uniref:Uncharacterized protein n=1 Tax=Oryza meyeriana var. granulata TaxID=110450 RepID=A0A6G1DY54_9ORYZ|nr:hypothetical protein E2562_016334 [Oryza meyeriana var. granulata]